MLREIERMDSKVIFFDKRRAIAVVSVLVSIGLIVWLLSRLDLGELVPLVAGARPGWLLASVLPSLMTITSWSRPASSRLSSAWSGAMLSASL